MNESTKTKKALRGSLFALFLCIVLLIGTTFAYRYSEHRREQHPGREPEGGFTDERCQW